VSPVLCDPNQPEPEIGAGVDVVTAIGIAPSDPNRIYIGCYSGKVWVTDAACNLPFCWSEESYGLPGAPITWIAVDPLDKEAAFATTSGFAVGSHVYARSTFLNKWIRTFTIAELASGVPANTITVEPHGPGDPKVLWLGTDKGVYRSPNGGSLWARYGTGLPNVPVYQIVIDATHDRIVAGTHGRGAFMLTGPTLENFDDCRVIYGYDLPVYGTGFDSNVPCTMKILREHGSVCGNGPFTKDADGGDLMTGPDGTLETSNGAFYNGKPVALACHAGKCAGGSTLGACNLPNDRIAAVTVTCGNKVAIDQIQGCPSLINPPSSRTTLSGVQFPFSMNSAGLCADSRAGSDPAICSNAVTGIAALLSSGSIDFIPTLQAGDGTSRALCEVNVPFAPTDTDSIVLQNARDAVNASTPCQTAGVSAEFAPAELVESEDPFNQPGSLWLTAPGLPGAQLVGSLDAAPGQAVGVCFELGNLGVATAGQIRDMRVRFRTDPGGAQGGSITVRTHSNLGDCSMTVPTAPGDTSMGIASALGTAFQSPELPSNSPQCPTGHNPRDISQQGDSLVMGMASEIRICLDDPGVGVSATPADVCRTDADCDDGNPCTRDLCSAASGQCQHASEPDGLPCDDQDACTIGNTCARGLCGTPITCDDGNPCTNDRCDPATGACQSAPTLCDDGNSCTADVCNRALGGCTFTPLTGQSCDDGDPCTHGDQCVQTSPTDPPTCQGQPTCDDGNPCSADSCDPATGACVNTPVQCDDGNPCTLDFCDSSGACNSVAGGPGGGCDDGDPCTTGDTCIPDPTGTPVCVGQAISCDDGNTCTQDICDPATGGCESKPGPINDVTGLTFTGSTTMTWSLTPGAASWNTYRGTIPRNLLGSRGLTSPTYDQVCFEQGDSHHDGARVTIDAQVPPTGTAFYYLVSEVVPCGEGPIGRDGNTTPIPNGSPCFVP
jgi:hypothetical protein